ALACLKTKTRLLYASTCCAYGNNNQEISDEDSPVSPTELYAETKLQGEKVIENVGGEYSLLRLATFYGPNMRPSLATSIFLRKILLGQEIEIHGDGKQTRCYTHVDDIASGIRIVLESVNTPKIINISDDTAYSVNDLVKIISKVTGKHPKVKYVNDRAGQIWSSSIKSMRMKQLGWQPKWNLMSGLTDCMNHLKS
ncbi:NAD-dependent epimerase/dehydratase family protein, partial [Shewanella sp. SG41-4]